MARFARAVLLLLAGLLPAVLGEDNEQSRSVASHVDPLSTSFYLSIRPKAKQLAAPCRTCNVKAQAGWLGKAVACGLICDAVVTKWWLSPYISRLSDRVAALLRGPAAQTVETKEEDMEPVEQLQEEFEISQRLWLGGATSLLALLATLAAIGKRARKRRSHKSAMRARLVDCSANDSDISTGVEGSPGRRSGADSTELEDDESDSDDKQTVAERKARRMFEEQGMGRQRTEPIVRKEDRRVSWSRSDDHELDLPKSNSGKILRQTSHPEPRRSVTIDEVLNTEGVRYGTNDYVRRRTRQYERRIDFHRMASENSVGAQDDDWEANMNLKTDFYRIGTEA